MFRRGAVIACAIAVAACSSGSGSAATTTTATTTTTTTLSTTTTTIPLAPAPSAQAAATTFINAWKAGDRDTASTVALPAAVDAVFSAGDPGSAENRGCNSPPADSPVLCVYRTGVGELQIRVQPQADGWVIDQALLSAA